MKIPKFLIRWIRAFAQDPEKYLKIAVGIVNLIKNAVKSGQITPDYIPETDTITSSSAKVALRETLAEVGLPWKSVIDAQVALYDIPAKERKTYWKAIAGGVHSRMAKLPLKTSLLKVEEYYQANKDVVTLEGAVL